MTKARQVGRGILFLWDHTLGWPIYWIELVLIRGYQTLLSPLMTPSCRYHPSCSAYGLGAIRLHGSLKGTALTAWRIVRCNPWNGGGVDPVPSVGRWLPDTFADGRPRPTEPQVNTRKSTRVRGNQR